VTVPSLLILGTDVVLAATPATPVQLAHACLAAGYQAVIPAAWGEELIAERALRRLRAEEGPFVHCSCPLVVRRLMAHGEALTSMLLSYVPPPVATAEYLRAVYAPTKVHLTFAGGCPGGRHEILDGWLTYEQLLGRLEERKIDLTSQPTEFDGILAPDRRRFYSEPGGIPTRSALRHLPSPVELYEVAPENLVNEVAQRLLSPGRALIDIAPALQCRCSGAVGSVRHESARHRVRETEPPRAFGPVLDHTIPLTLDSALPITSPLATNDEAEAPSSFSAAPISMSKVAPNLGPSTTPIAALPEVAPVPTAAAVLEIPSRRTPSRASRPVLGTMPHARTDTGRQLPRAYVARRRSTPRSIRASGLRTAEPATANGSTRRNRLLLIAATISGGIAIAYLWRMIA
jgi:hypothetical protein